MVTLKHIAEKAGVTVSVVSRALNPRPDRHARVAPETKTRIEEAARTLGFKRNRNAEFLKRGMSPIIQVLLPIRPCAHMAQVMCGMAEAAEAENYPLSFSFGSSEERLTAFLRSVCDNRSCGAVVYQPQAVSTVSRKTIASHRDMRLVFAGWADKSVDGHPTLSFDLKEGVSLAIRHLIGKGISRLAVVGRFPALLTAFEDGCRHHGIKPDLFSLAESDAVRQWAFRHQREAGLFAMTDILAMQAVRLLQASGLRVPEDVRVLGHGEHELARHLKPALSTIRYPYREMGREGIRMLVRMMHGEAVGNRQFAPVLVPRFSA